MYCLVKKINNLKSFAYTVSDKLNYILFKILFLDVDSILSLN